METIDKVPQQEISVWPPAYDLRVSKKAKHVHLKVIPNRGLEIVVPIRQLNKLIVSELLEAKKGWIAKHLATLQIKPITAITSLSLRAIQQSWQIEYKQTFSSQLRHSICKGVTINTLTLYGDVSNVTRTNLWIKKWLMQMAQQHLLPWLDSLSTTHQLSFNKAAVRGQQTLWGSCTMEKNISLNYKLLFVPPNYAEHIMLHELCHTKYLNHSKRFWALLYKLDPAAAYHNQAIREGDNFVPISLI